MQYKSGKKPLDPTPEQQAAKQARQEFFWFDRLRPTSPCRLPDWRWQMVQVLDEYPFYKRYLREDPGVKMARQLIKYLQYLDALGSRRPRRKRPPAEVLEAYALFCRPPRLQAELKARLLAQEPLPQIAEKMGISVAAIPWYEQLFFHVLDRLNANSYIFRFVTEISKIPRQHPAFFDHLLMELGYNAGPRMVDALLPLQDRVQEPLTLADFLPTTDRQESLLRSVKRLIEVRTTLFEPSCSQPLLDVRGCAELDRREEQTQVLTIQLQDLQALSNPLADMDLVAENLSIEQDYSWQDAYSSSTAPMVATSIAV